MPCPRSKLNCKWPAIIALTWQLGAGACTSLAAEAAAAASEYSVRTWQMDDGLPRNTITAISQTPNGYLWLGTPFGVIRFDGTAFMRIEGDGHAGFTRARTRVLYTDRQDRLWIGTGTAGIIRQDGRGFNVINSSNGLSHPTVSAICEDLNGTVWIGTQDGTLSWVDREDRVHAIAPVRGEKISAPIELVRDVNGTLWFSQRDAYGQIVNGAVTNLTVVPNASVVLCPSHDGAMWVGVGNVLQKIRPGEPAFETIPLPVTASLTPVLFEDRQKNLWLGSGQWGGVFRLSAREFVRQFNTSHRIHSIYQDAESNLWVGTEGGGLSQLRPRIFRALTTREGLPHSMLRSVCEATNGDIWLSGQGSMLVKWRKESGFGNVAGSTNFGTTCVLPKPDGGIWVGTVGRGLLSVEHGQLQPVGPRGPFLNRQIRSLHQDRRGQLWLGCLPDGLARLSASGTNFPQEFFDQGLPRDAIWSIADDAGGDVWLGTIAGELWRYNGTNFSVFGAAEGLPGASIGALHFTTEGDLWIGTLGGGLGRFRDGIFVFAGVREGLADNVITGIVEDELGFFWLQSDRGILRVRRQELDDFADGKRARFDCVLHGRSDGLANIECISGYQPSAWQTRSGDIWFATSKGAVVVNPKSLPTRAYSPPLVLEKIIVDDVEVKNWHHLKFAYGYRQLDFSYAAPTFTAPEQVRFRHQLAGLDPDWIEAGSARMASYPRLAPGRYEFRFSASGPGGQWSEHFVSVPFEVTPAYWQTAWFRFAALALFGAAVVGGVRYLYVQKMRRKLLQLEQDRAVEQERMRIARDIHDDLGARLTQMAFLSDLVVGEVGEQGKTGERLTKLANSSREAIRSLDEIVWAVNPRKDTLPQFVDYLSHHANEFFCASPTRCRQNLPLIIPHLPLATDFRHHLFLACKEAFNNASKHAGATEVWLSLNLAGADLEIVIEDNGRGFIRTDSATDGNGLTNMSNRLAAIGGCCRVESRPTHGTRVQFQVKLPAAPAAVTKPTETKAESPH